MANNIVVSNRSDLEKRVARFVKREFLSSQAVGPFIERLKMCGKAAIFGGLIRDLALGHARSFSSDADIVLDPAEESMLEMLFRRQDVIRNKYGGYRIQKGRWVFDVWTISSTWAFKNNLVPRHSLENLLETTFFNWDAALYDLDENHIICGPDYIEDLTRKVLSVNLLDTPNEKGAAVKALRLIASEAPLLRPELARFLYSAIENHGIRELVRMDQGRRTQVRLTLDFVGAVAIALSHHQRLTPHAPFRGVPAQRELFDEAY